MNVCFPLSEPILPEKARFVTIVEGAVAIARTGARVRLMLPDTRVRLTRYAADHLGIDIPETLDVATVRAWHRRLGWPFTWNGVVHRAICRSLVQDVRTEPSVVQVRHLKLAAALARRRPGYCPPIVFEAHGIAADDLRESGARTADIVRADHRMRSVMQAAAGLVATSEGLRAEICRRYPFRGPSAVVRTGVNLTHFPYSWHGRDGLDRPRRPRIVYVGRLDGWKGVTTLVRAMALIGEAHLVLIGGGPPTVVEEIRRLARELGLLDRLELAGRMAHGRIASILSSTDVAVHPLPRDRSIAFRDTSPLKIFEYLAVGVPVVASDMPSMRELVTHGESALLTPPGNPEALGRTIARLLADRALARRLSAAGRHIAERHSFEARARTLLDFYATLPDSRPA